MRGILRRVVVGLRVRQRCLGLVARLPVVHGRLVAVVEAHMPPVVAVGLRVGRRRRDSRMRRHGRHGVLVDTAAGRERSAQLGQGVVGGVGLDHRFSGRIGGERRRVCRGVRGQPVFLHGRESVGFMLSSVVDRRRR